MHETVVKEEPRAPVAKKDKEREDQKGATTLSNLVIYPNEIGSGNFGKVYKGRVRIGKKVHFCVVKVANREEGRADLLKEADLMSGIFDPNIVKYLGKMEQNGIPHMLLEYMSNGALDKFLQNNTVSKMVKGALIRDAAKGMAYLHQIPLIHRDFAARNCLVDERRVVKVSDLGMSRSGSTFVAAVPLDLPPAPWVAPETWKLPHHFSLKSDVYAFGIFIWEVSKNGAQPYSGVTDEVVLGLTKAGSGPSWPPAFLNPIRLGIKNTTKELAVHCWKQEPSARPTMDQVVNRLKEYENVERE